MTIDARIERLMDLLAQLTAASPSAPARDAEEPFLSDDSTFDAERTVVDRDVPPAVAEALSSAPAPAGAAQGSRSRLIAAQRAELAGDDADTNDDGDDAPDDAPSHERPPISSRRPVLPDHVAPVLPDMEWEDPSEVIGPPESGPHFAASALDEADDDVTGVRSAASLLSAAVVTPSPHAAFEGDEPDMAEATDASGATAFVAAVKSFRPATFGELIDATIEL